jgi:diguanylate cyclase (GGDEF)-like protein/PAS domain S-box-containing protein
MSAGDPAAPATPPAGRRRRVRRVVQPVAAAVVLAAMATALYLVAVNAVLLSRMTAEVRLAQRHSADLADATHEAQLLLQTVTQLGETTAAHDSVVQSGLLLRHLTVAAASFPPGAAEGDEIREIRRRLAAFPWDRLRATEGRSNPLRVQAMALASSSERRLEFLRNVQEAHFYDTTIESLDAKRNSQAALGALVALVLVVGTAGLVALTRRNRSDVAHAYEALEGEVTERHAAEEALRASEGRFRSLVQRASDLTVLTDVAGVVTFASPSIEALLGFTPAELVDLPLVDHIDAADRDVATAVLTELAASPGLVRTVELRLRTRDGRVRMVEAVCQNLVGDPDLAGVVWNARDVTDRRALEDELTRQANHDPLTGLPNRSLLLTRLGSAVRALPCPPEPAAVSGDARCLSVLLVDLDGFKSVNDTLGHPAGDELLRCAAERLRACVREGDTAARLGGDEFAVVLPSASRADAIAVSRRIVETLRRPVEVGGQEVSIGASVGVAHRDGQASAADLLRDADIAMYVAKNTGKGHHVVFEPTMRVRAARRTALQQQLARAVDLGEIEVHYQPIVDLGSYRVRGLEALARWRSPEGPLVPPDEFIPIAEETGAIVPIGRNVLLQACRDMQRWRTSMPDARDLQVSVNVSVRQVLSGVFVDDVADALADSRLPAAALVLEITESAQIDDSERLAAEFARLKRLGASIAVDDFGSGYSSLSFLLGLDADVLKIDRTLLDFDTTRRGSLVQAISDLGRTLGLTVVVEGVETPEHLARAREALCDAAQGFHFSRPLLPQHVPAVLAGGPVIPFDAAAVRRGERRTLEKRP